MSFSKVSSSTFNAQASGSFVDSAGTVWYKERPGSGVLDFSQDRVTGTRIYRILWDDRKTFLRLLFGPPLTGKVLPKETNIVNKSFDNQFPDLIASRASVVPAWDNQQPARDKNNTNQGPPSVIDYNYADVTVIYEMVPDFSFEVEFSTETISVAASKYKFSGGASDGNPAHSSVSIAIPVVDILLRFFARSLSTTDTNLLNWNNIVSNQGKVNDATVSLGPATIGAEVTAELSDIDCVAGTLLFVSGEMRAVNYYDVPDMMYQYHFRYNRNGWNKAYDIDEQAFTNIVSVSGSNKAPYETGTFAGNILPSSLPDVMFTNEYRS